MYSTCTWKLIIIACLTCYVMVFVCDSPSSVDSEISTVIAEAIGMHSIPHSSGRDNITADS